MVSGYFSFCQYSKHVSVFFKNIFGNILRNLVTTSFEMRPFLVLSEYI